MLEGRNVDFGLDVGGYGEENFDEETGEGVLDVLLLHLEKVVAQFVEEGNGILEVLDGMHLDAEELDAHEEGDDVLHGKEL